MRRYNRREDDEETQLSGNRGVEEGIKVRSQTICITKHYNKKIFFRVKILFRIKEKSKLERIMAFLLLSITLFI